MPLLGLPAIQSRCLLQQMAAVQAADDKFKKMSPKVFSGLGKLQGSYKIEAAEGVVPYALSAPRCVALSQMDKVKSELHRMEDMGQELTEWCAGMVVVRSPVETSGSALM